eukprot:GFKZ01005055.1.p7 GENE.GFKZ01005055.1~~GFKZ01005055.1.p7  ORF type:complete len:105 (+),score=10.51 GFKZ01005055.1:669-983(+)
MGTCGALGTTRVSTARALAWPAQRRFAAVGDYPGDRSVTSDGVALGAVRDCKGGVAEVEALGRLARRWLGAAGEEAGVVRGEEEREGERREREREREQEREWEQ